MEGIFSIMAIQNQELYAGLNFSEADEDSNIVPIDQYGKSEIKHVLSNSFGFGGNNSSLIFSKI
jgi:3-oxoacyl-[acyl-carrier-protein] synthase-1